MVVAELEIEKVARRNAVHLSFYSDSLSNITRTRLTAVAISLVFLCFAFRKPK